MVYAQGVGTKCASFYKAWADQLDMNNDLQRADQVFQMALANEAEPKEVVEQAHSWVSLFLPVHEQLLAVRLTILYEHFHFRAQVFSNECGPTYDDRTARRQRQVCLDRNCWTTETSARENKERRYPPTIFRSPGKTSFATSQQVSWRKLCIFFCCVPGKCTSMLGWLQTDRKMRPVVSSNVPLKHTYELNNSCLQLVTVVSFESVRTVANLMSQLE